jgi:uncharacterized metal-binding protein YceD (DUF177 family)
MFRISFAGLSLGHHTFEFHVDDVFFEAFNYDEISNCNIDIKINLEKTERFLKLDFEFYGDYFVPCDRCLDPIEIPVNHDETLIVNFGNENDFDSEIWTIASKEHELILDNFIYEALVLLRPFSVMHEIENCNPEMIKKLYGTDCKSAPAGKLNVGTGHARPLQENDPRWDALKALKDKLN